MAESYFDLNQSYEPLIESTRQLEIRLSRLENWKSFLTLFRLCSELNEEAYSQISPIRDELIKKININEIKTREEADNLKTRFESIDELLLNQYFGSQTSLTYQEKMNVFEEETVMFPNLRPNWYNQRKQIINAIKKEERQHSN